MYTVTINFPTVKTPSVNGALSLKLMYDASGSNSTVYSDEVKLFVKDLGDIVTEHDVLDTLMVPTYLKPTFTDIDGYLFNLLTGVYTNSDKLDARIEMNLTLSGAVSETFKMYLIEDTLDYDYKAKELKFDAAPKADILNQTLLFNKETNDPLDIFGYGANTYVPLITLVQALFTLADSSAPSVQFFHTLKYAGVDVNDANDIYINRTLEDVYLPTNQLFFEQGNSNNTAGDLLKIVAASFWARAGWNGSQPFFASLESDYPNVVVDAADVINKKLAITTPMPKVIKINHIDGSTANFIAPNKYQFPPDLSATNVPDEFQTTVDVLFFANGSVTYNNGTANNGGQNFRIRAFNGLGDTVYCHAIGVRDEIFLPSYFEIPPFYQTYEPTRDFIGWKTVKYARAYSLSRVADFELQGVNYNILTDYEINGVLYRPISLTRKLHENYTEFKGVPIVEG